MLINYPIMKIHENAQKVTNGAISFQLRHRVTVHIFIIDKIFLEDFGNTKNK